MHFKTPFIIALSFSLISIVYAESNQTNDLTKQSASLASQASFTPFTGKILRNKVRLRLQPNLEGHVLRELNNGDLVLVTGEKEDFYSIEAPADLKTYVYRTFVLDNVIEGSHVNVRLEPDLNSPIVAQLNSGDIVTGTTYAKDKKWFEMAAPKSAHVYVAKDYVKNIGSESLFASLTKKRQEFKTILLSSQKEIGNAANHSAIAQKLNRVIHEASDFPEYVAKAKELLGELRLQPQKIEETALAKQETILTDAPKDNEISWSGQSTLVVANVKAPRISTEPTPKMLAWMPIEELLYQSWASQKLEPTQEAFYADQAREASMVRGIIEPYNKAIKNKPGDYILVHSADKLPAAYLYSTKVNLDDLVGQEITLTVVPRSNHHFAFPAYYVLNAE